MPKGYEVARLDVKAGRLEASLPKGARIVALDERGKALATVEFSRLLGEPAAFVIGGADGLPEEFRSKAHLVMSLSSLTLAHALAQVVLMEQLYRAATLLTGHPYHRA